MKQGFRDFVSRTARLFMFVWLASLLLCTSSFAQNNLSDYVGRWLRYEIVTDKGQHLPRVVWKITIEGKKMILLELSEQGETVKKSSYEVKKLKLDASDGAMQLPDNSITSGSLTMDISETWQLSQDRNTLKVVRKIHPRAKNSPLSFGDSSFSFQRVSDSSSH